MRIWKEMGCPVCRRQWESGPSPPEIAVSIARQASLHRCNTCGAYWEETQRFATIIDEVEARVWFPDAFAQE